MESNHPNTRLAIGRWYESPPEANKVATLGITLTIALVFVLPFALISFVSTRGFTAFSPSDVYLLVIAPIVFLPISALLFFGRKEQRSKLAIGDDYLIVRYSGSERTISFQDIIAVHVERDDLIARRYSLARLVLRTKQQKELESYYQDKPIGGQGGPTWGEAFKFSARAYSSASSGNLRTAYKNSDPRIWLHADIAEQIAAHLGARGVKIGE